MRAGESQHRAARFVSKQGHAVRGDLPNRAAAEKADQPVVLSTGELKAPAGLEQIGIRPAERMGLRTDVVHLEEVIEGWVFLKAPGARDRKRQDGQRGLQVVKIFRLLVACQGHRAEFIGGIGRMGDEGRAIGVSQVSEIRLTELPIIQTNLRPALRKPVIRREGSDDLTAPGARAIADRQAGIGISGVSRMLG